MNPLHAYIFPILDSLALPTSAHLAVAVSGGSDSMALAYILHAYANAKGHRITVLTVNHGLRPESAREAAQVCASMQALGIPHHILSCAPIDSSRNLQAHARAARYDALAAWCNTHQAHALCIGHHAEDQAETVALQRHRGSTPPSRAGMACVTYRASLPIIRPLLGVRKQQLQIYLTEHAIAWIEDPSNASDRHSRNRIRRTMDDAEVKALWHEAQHMGEARNRDDVMRNTWLSEHKVGITDGTVRMPFVAWQNLPPLLRSDVLSHIICIVGGNPHRPRLHETLRLVKHMLASPKDKATLGKCIVAWNHAKGHIHITPEPLRKVALDVGSSLPHMKHVASPKSLEVRPFQWFNSSPYF